MVETEFAFIPRTIGNPLAFLALAQIHYHEHLFRQNLHILNGVDPNLADTQPERDRFTSRLSFVNGLSREKQRMLAGIPYSQTTQFYLKKIGIPFLGTTPLSDEDIQQKLTEHLRAQRGPVGFLSDSHHTTLLSLQAVKQMNPRANVGLFVFDRHMDAYYTQPPLRAEDQKWGKANFLQKTLGDMTARGAVIMGVNHGAREQFLHEFMGKGNPREQFNKIRKQLRISDEGDYRKRADYSPRYDAKKLLQETRKNVRFLHRTGAQQLVFSIDIDVLRLIEGDYTGMDYNPFNSAMYLGSQDLSYVANPLHSDRMKKAIHRTMVNYILEQPVASENHEFKTMNRLHHMQERNGLTIALILQSMMAAKEEALKLGMEIGVQLPRGAVYLGDITELDGPDYKGKTTKAAVRLMSFF